MLNTIKRNTTTMAIKKAFLGASFILISLIAAIYPLIIVPVFIISVCVMLMDIPLSRLTHFLFYVILVSAILGPYLSIPGLGGLFLFRIALLLHFSFFLFEKKDWSEFSLLKIPLMGFALWILVATLTLIWSGDLSLSMRAIYFQLESFYVIFLCVYYVRSIADIRKMFMWIMPPFILSVGVGCYEMLTGKHLWYSSLKESGYLDYRPTGFLTNTNDFSSYLSIYFPVFIYLVLQKKTMWRTLIALSSAIVLFLLVIATESRTGLLAFLMTVVFMVWKLYSKQIASFIMFVGGCLGGIYFLTMKFFETQEFSYFFGKQTSTDQRLFIYETVLNVAKESHFLGVGIGVIPKFVFEALYGTVNIPTDLQQTMSAHNFWLATLADVGIIGLGCFALFFGWLSFQAIKLFLTEKGMLAGLPLCIIIAFIAISIGSSSIFEMRVVWLGIGLALAIIHLNLKEKEGNL
ncbi:MULTISPECIES: O-antigen ligase [Listeria]|uniref:O-antigen ligase family protein n=1 Tax=Listeria TaxID=1637 RepID=UPI000B5935BC|nr:MULTISPECIES: O-antigen ligase family protein [Listeria]